MVLFMDYIWLSGEYSDAIPGGEVLAMIRYHKKKQPVITGCLFEQICYISMI